MLPADIDSNTAAEATMGGPTVARIARADGSFDHALLHALHVHGEPCGWCGASATEPSGEGGALSCAPSADAVAGNDWGTATTLQCSRCGWEVPASRQTVEDTGDDVPPG